MLSQSDAEMSDTLHGQDVRLAFGCQRGRRPPATNSSGTSCWVCLQGREKKREEGRADIAYYVLPSQLEKASAVSGWDCWWFSVVRGEHKRKNFPFPACANGEPASPGHPCGRHHWTPARPPLMETRRRLTSACEFCPWEGCDGVSG